MTFSGLDIFVIYLSSMKNLTRANILSIPSISAKHYLSLCVNYSTDIKFVLGTKEPVLRGRELFQQEQ